MYTGKRNKELCRKCIYRGGVGHSEEGERDLCCLYSTYTHQSCKMRDGSDRRGADLTKCNLFVEGEPKKVSPRGTRRKLTLREMR